MITDAQERKDFSVILVWSQDRFSRLTADETGYFRTLLKNSGVEIISITESWLNGEDIGSRIARNAMQEVKHEYVRDMAKSVIRGQHSNIVDARSDPGRRAPYGYDRALLNSDNTIYQIIRWFPGWIREIYTSDGKLQRRVEKGIRLKKEKGLRAILVPGEENRIDAIRKIFRFCVEGSGFKAIADLRYASRPAHFLILRRIYPGATVLWYSSLNLSRCKKNAAVVYDCNWRARCYWHDSC